MFPFTYYSHITKVYNGNTHAQIIRLFVHLLWVFKCYGMHGFCGGNHQKTLKFRYNYKLFLKSNSNYKNYVYLCSRKIKNHRTWQE